MANTITQILPKILARALIVLRSKIPMASLVNGDYSEDAMKFGSTIDIPIPGTMGSRAVTPSSTLPTLVDRTRETKKLNLDQWRETDPFHLSDKELNEIDANQAYLPQSIQEGVEVLATDINTNIFSNYKGVYNLVGDPAQIAFSSAHGSEDVAVQARKVLNINKAPEQNRRVIMNYTADAEALKIQPFQDASRSGTTRTIIEGQIGEKFGMDFYNSHGVPNHITGAAPLSSGPAVDQGAGYAIGTTTFHADGFTATPIEGDIFSFANHTQQYVVASVANYSSGDVDITFQPPLVAAVVDDEAMTFVDDHSVNLAFHRDAFAFATRILLEQSLLGQANEGHEFVMVDPVSGIPMRITLRKVHRAYVWFLDILWGSLLLRPELACRVAGSTA